MAFNTTYTNELSSYDIRTGGMLEYDLANAKLKRMHVKIAFGATDTYVTGGFALLSTMQAAFPQIQSIIGAVQSGTYSGLNGWVAQYTVDSGKVSLWNGTTEMASNATTIQSAYIILEVICTSAT